MNGASCDDGAEPDTAGAGEEVAELFARATIKERRASFRIVWRGREKCIGSHVRELRDGVVHAWNINFYLSVNISIPMIGMTGIFLLLVLVVLMLKLPTEIFFYGVHFAPVVKLQQQQMYAKVWMSTSIA